MRKRRRRESPRIIGRRAVLEAIVSGRRKIEKIVVARGGRGATYREIVALAERYDLPVAEIERNRLDRMAGTREHQGVMALVSELPREGLSSLLARAQIRREDPFIVALDGIEDPHNLGAMIRTALGAGCHGVLMREKGSPPLDFATAKASAGAVEHIPVVRTGGIERAIDEMRTEGLRVVGLENRPEAENIWKANLGGPILIVVGSEGRGISGGVRTRCETLVSIPMEGGISSLNASVSLGIALYEVRRRRRSE